MKIKAHIICLLTFLCYQWLVAQELPVLKVENHLKGELDYTHETLTLIKKQANGKEISLGKITPDGKIHFKMPNYNIKALYDSIPLQHYKFQQLFGVNSDCKDRDIFAKTPFDDVYSEKTNGIYIKKYGINVAVLEAKSIDKTSNFFWFYIDRATSYADKCAKVNYKGDLYATVNATLKFKKGWNFLEENTIMVSNDNNTQVKKIKFENTLPTHKKIKWTLRQIHEDEKIATAKRLDNLIPITQKQFEKWVPKKVGDLVLTSKEYGNPPKRQSNKNNIRLAYTNKTEKQIDLYVIDLAKRPNDMEMVDFMYAMDNRKKEEKDIKPYIYKYNERDKEVQLLYKFKERILVDAKGKNLNEEELWQCIQKLNLNKLLKE